MRLLPHLGWAISGNGKGQQLPERSIPCSDSSKTEEWGGITEAQLKTLPPLNRELCFSWDELLCSPNGPSEGGWWDSPSCRRAGGRYAASSAPKDSNTDRVSLDKLFFKNQLVKSGLKAPTYVWEPIKGCSQLGANMCTYLFPAINAHQLQELPQSP